MGFGKFFGLGNKDIQEKDVQAAEKELLPKAEVKYEPAELPIEQIQVNPFQPRRIFQKEALQELAASVQEFGILQPLLVRRKGDTAELIAGERRLRAAKMAGLKQDDMDLIELNEAFASQSLAVIRSLDLDPDIVNVNGGAIALGHPLGCSGAKLSVQILNELKRREQRYGMVTMCVGTGQGAAGVFEML